MCVCVSIDNVALVEQCGDYRPGIISRVSNPVWIPDDNADVTQKDLTEADKQMVEFVDWTDPIDWRNNDSHLSLLKQWKRTALRAGFEIMTT